MGGQKLAIQDLKGHITVLLEAMFAMVELLLMLIIRRACTLELTYLEQMQRSCLVNGSFRLGRALALKWVTTSMSQDI